jgi:hypothetical protein
LRGKTSFSVLRHANEVVAAVLHRERLAVAAASLRIAGTCVTIVRRHG